MPGAVGGDSPLGLQLAELALERRSDLLCRDAPRPPRPVSRNRLGAPLDRFHQLSALAGPLRRAAQLIEGLVEQKHRWHQPHLLRRPGPVQLAIELRWQRLQPRQVGFGVGGVLDPVVAVQEPRDIEVCPHILYHHVRRVAPAADGDIAVGQRETLQCGRIGAPHHGHAGAHHMREPRRVDGVDPLEIPLDLPSQPRLPLGGAIEEAGPQAGPGAGIEAERGRGFREQAEQALGELVEQRVAFLSPDAAGDAWAVPELGGCPQAAMRGSAAVESSAAITSRRETGSVMGWGSARSRRPRAVQR
jgi:hypothetical protein